MSSSFTDSYDHELPFLASQQVQDTPYQPPFYISDEGLNSDPAQFSTFLPEIKPLEDGVAVSNGSILPPPPTETQDESFAVREWRRQNALQLEEKEKIEKELLNHIMNEAEEYKVEFYRKRQASLETSKAACREKEKLFLTSHEKLQSEADKHFWKAIAELIPNEAPALEKKKPNKDQEKKPIIAVIQGPKPGKPTDLSRMRQILLKLKQNTPAHLNTSPPPPFNTTNAAKLDNVTICI